jgi:hypothetical protein
VRSVGAGTDGLGEDVSVFREDGTALQAMTIQHMEHAGIVGDDLAAAMAERIG